MENYTAMSSDYEIEFDRKIHFNQLTDYSVIQDYDMRRAGIFAVRMTLESPHGIKSSIVLPGVIDAIAVRDKLVALDFEREKLPG